ncbi:hypothetical protein IH992_17625 [Candidatus Poribacteria bacterium]|nr:hypothetical protein [Candidatus Poribacteria bacterium]
MLTFDSTPTSDYQPIHSLEPEELDERSKIPFNFLHIPFRLIDDDIIASLDGNTVKVLTIICRYLNLTEKILIGKRVILSGWGIPISYDHIAKKTGLSRRTVIRKVKILVEREILQVEKVRRCNSYRLTEYAICIEEVTTIYEEQAGHNTSEQDTTASEQPTTSEQQSQPRQQATATEQQAPEEEPIIKPGVPTDERLEEMIQQQVVSTVSPIIEQTVSRMALLIEGLSKETLSEKNQYDRKSAHDVKIPSPSISQLKALYPNWQDYQKYAKNFYGIIPSKKLLVNACVYFEEKVSEYGICDDGFDPVMEMIPVIKTLGARTHKAFDTEYGIRAFNKVMDNRDYQKQQQAMRTEYHGQQPSSSADNSHDTQTHSANEQPVEDDEPDNSSNNVPPRRPAHIKTSAKQAVASQVYARHCLAGIGQGEQYTDEDIKELWAKEYQRFGQPQNAKDWVKDRIHLWHKQAQWGQKEPITDADIANLWIEADKIFAENHTVEEDKSANENVTSDV